MAAVGRGGGRERASHPRKVSSRLRKVSSRLRKVSSRLGKVSSRLKEGKQQNMCNFGPRFS